MIKTIQNICLWITNYFSTFWDKPFSVKYTEDPIDHPKGKVLYVIGTVDEPWQVEMRCPCGCNEKIVLPVNYETSPRWSITVSKESIPTLHPSIWRSKGCKSHFFLRQGKIEWV